MKSDPHCDDVAVLIMAKAPRPGLVKTRLQPLLGATGSARLQVALIAHTVKLAQKVSPSATYLALDPPDRSALPPSADRVRLLAQHGDDLGSRMAKAVGEIQTNREGPVLVIGTDAPTLCEAHLRAAASALRDGNANAAGAPDGGGADGVDGAGVDGGGVDGAGVDGGGADGVDGAGVDGAGVDGAGVDGAGVDGADVVFGPALDGGYYLIGLREPAPDVFAIDPALWGSALVLDASLRAAERAGLRTALLEPLRDLDTPADARAFLDETALGEAGLGDTAPNHAAAHTTVLPDDIAALLRARVGAT